MYFFNFQMLLWLFLLLNKMWILSGHRAQVLNIGWEMHLKTCKKWKQLFSSQDGIWVSICEIHIVHKYLHIYISDKCASP